MKQPERTEAKSTLALHHKMYERRLRRIEQRGGLSEREAAEQANDPSLFRRKPRADEAEEGSQAAAAK
jgi:hypothetical protein